MIPELVTVAALVALFAGALRADVRRLRSVCPCGCGNPVHRHNPPRSF